MYVSETRYHDLSIFPASQPALKIYVNDQEY